MNLYSYTNYREYLRDYYRFMKERDTSFSYRVFLNNADLSGPNFYREVVDGKKNLSPTSSKKFAKALNLSKRETQYFENLVLFNQAKNTKKKQQYFETLVSFGNHTDIYEIPEKQYKYFSKWYNLTIREYIHANQFSGNYNKLLEDITPKISLRQAQNSVSLLEELHLIKKDENNVYYLTEPLLTTGPEIKQMGIYSFYKSMLDVSKKALDTFKSDDRYFRSMTGSFSDEAAFKIKLELDNTRKKILDIIKSDKGDKKVHQIGIQMFPMQKERQRKRKKNGEN